MTDPRTMPTSELVLTLAGDPSLTYAMMKDAKTQTQAEYSETWRTRRAAIAAELDRRIPVPG